MWLTGHTYSTWMMTKSRLFSHSMLTALSWLEARPPAAITKHWGRQPGIYWSIRAECQAVGAASSPHCQPGVVAAPSAQQPDDCRRKSMPQVGSQSPSLINAAMVLGRHSRRDPASNANFALSPCRAPDQALKHVWGKKQLKIWC
ncbi:hypothetical protein B0H14DRAFT_3128674 [Mycena olivaceomarginata]|nr:hypothetical protein B0H14DRAFT_3128674 [Mycena olivaceomarginata]